MQKLLTEKHRQDTLWIVARSSWTHPRVMEIKTKINKWTKLNFRRKRSRWGFRRDGSVLGAMWRWAGPKPLSLLREGRCRKFLGSLPGPKCRGTPEGVAGRADWKPCGGGSPSQWSQVEETCKQTQSGSKIPFSPVFLHSSHKSKCFWRLMLKKINK